MDACNFLLIEIDRMKKVSHKRNSCSSTFVKLDGFGQSFDLVLPDYSTKLLTVPGAICWIVMMAIIVSFSGYRFSLLIKN